MKYIIEIEDEPLVRDGEKLWKASAFKSLVFDQNGLDKLTPYQESEKEEEFHVGDEVKRKDGEEVGIVLVPDAEYGEFVALFENYTCPQYCYKQNWEKTGYNRWEVREFVALAAKALEAEKE